MKVCIVGNGDSILGKNLGSLIDSYDTVVRMNRTFTRDLENDTGNKISDWVISSAMLQNQHGHFKDFFNDRLPELIDQGLQNIIVRYIDQESYEKNTDILNNVKVNVIHADLIPNIGELLPSTGYFCIKRYLEEGHSVDIAGFGCPKDDLSVCKHYWPPNKIINFQKFNHDLEIERYIIGLLPVNRIDCK